MYVMYVMIEACMIVYYQGYMIYILPCVALFKSTYIMYVMIEACIVYYQGEGLHPVFQSFSENSPLYLGRIVN